MRSNSSHKPSSQSIDLAASAQRLDVDNRISLRHYFRIADNILEQADIFRREKNIIDLYIMLLRFSSLVSETIPCHRDYRGSLQSQKVYLKKKLLATLTELEELKPAVQKKIDDLNKKHAYHVNGSSQFHRNNSWDWSPVKKQSLTNYDVTKAARPAASQFPTQGSRAQQFSYARPMEEQFHKLSFSIPCPKEETPFRHSILGPNGLHGQWQPPISDKGVQYPSNIDLTPVEIPRENSLQKTVDDGLAIGEDCSNAGQENSRQESILTSKDDTQKHCAEEPSSLISFETTQSQPNIIRQPSPPPVLAEVQDSIPAVSHTCSPNVLAEIQDLIPAVSFQVSESGCGTEMPLKDNFVQAESPLQLHISTDMMETFMKLAKSNTVKNFETCGVLAGSLKNRKFMLQLSSFQSRNQHQILVRRQMKRKYLKCRTSNLFSLLGGFIFQTHPTQSCFMSSIDLHTHYSYQVTMKKRVSDSEEEETVKHEAKFMETFEELGVAADIDMPTVTSPAAPVAPVSTIPAVSVSANFTAPVPAISTVLTPIGLGPLPTAPSQFEVDSSSTIVLAPVSEAAAFFACFDQPEVNDLDPAYFWGSGPPYVDFHSFRVPEDCASHLVAIYSSRGDFMQGFRLGRFAREHFLKLLGSVMNDIEHNFVDTISTERILQWRAAIQELVTVGFAVEFILNHLREIARAFFMRRVQPAVDAIDTRIEALRKEVADLESHRECLLSSIGGSSRFGDLPLISGFR